MFVKSSLAALMLVSTAALCQAQDVTLRVHHFMSAQSTLHKEFLEPFAQRLSEASEGRIALQIFDSMSRGGPPPGLIDRAIEGADDIILTLPGYTPGRFNQSEVFELPFMMEDTVDTTKAYWQMVQDELQENEFQDVKILAAWVHGRGLLHSADPITRLEDIQGVEMRGPTRTVTDLLGELGASPVGMPLPAIPENLSKGVIRGAGLPWEITTSIKMGELVRNHTEFAGPRALYTATFVVAMNWDAYEDLPDDLRAILDAQSGEMLSVKAAEAVVAGDARAREFYSGNNIVVLPEEEVARWIAAAEPVYNRWIERADENGFDGAQTIETARKLISEQKQGD